MTFSLMLLAALAIPGAPATGTLTLQDSRDVNGMTVTSVRHSGGGRFSEAGPNQWNEYAANGRVVAVFQVYNRDTFSVVLHDRSRNTSVIIDLRARTIVSGTIGRAQRFLYSVTGLEAARRNDDRGGRDWRDDDRGPGRDVRDRDVRDRDDRGRNDGRPVEVGPIWNQRDAEAKCPAKARELRGEWTGGWWTTQPGRMSVCEIRSWGGNGGRGNDGRGGWGQQREILRDIEVGPIWNQNDAVAKCNAKGRELRAEWTGQWRTTQNGRMSECQFRFR